MYQYEIIKAIAESGGDVATVTVVDLKGSAPRHLGSMMLVLGDGRTLGTVGGGAVEARAVEAARECIAHRHSGSVRVEMTGEQALGSEPICGGSVVLAIEYVADPSLYATAAALLDRGERIVFVNDGGNVAVLNARGELAGGANPHGARTRAFDRSTILAVLESGEPAVSAKDGLLYEPIQSPERLLILGGGHVGLAVARFAVELDFRVCVGDPRPEFADPARFPKGVETRCGNFTDIVAEYPFGGSTYVVIVSPSHTNDLECVRAVLGREYRYAGFIGSRRKTKMIMDQALSEGFDAAKVQALRAPIGADIGAETPAEIAVSILAEIVAVRRNSPAAAAMDADRARRRA